ncbi:MAG: ferrous iron transport protein A [Thermotogota bacterium]|nr:ferrous iron transport protein A [Thermotogota bacterium]
MVYVSEMKVGTSGKVTAIKATSMIKKRLLAMGLTPGTEFKIAKVAPMGDPIELKVRGYRLSLRKSEASCLEADTVGND